MAIGSSAYDAIASGHTVFPFVAVARKLSMIWRCLDNDDLKINSLELQNKNSMSFNNKVRRNTLKSDQRLGTSNSVIGQQRQWN